jgi:hypothetical protein
MLLMSRHQDDAPPTWFRLSEESWAEIGEAYRNGATARTLAAKWKVSPTSIYRHACKDGWSKKAHGDAVARAHVAAVRAEADARREVATAPTPDPPLSTDPADLRQVAMARLAQAIHGGREDEALRLTNLVQKLERLTPPPPSPTDGYPDDGGAYVDWRPTREAVEREVEIMFREVVTIAYFMLKDPDKVPHVFRRRVREFRKRYLGEDDAEAMAKANHYTEYVLKELEGVVMDFHGPEPKPAIRRARRTWPPASPPFPSP